MRPISFHTHPMIATYPDPTTVTSFSTTLGSGPEPVYYHPSIEVR